MHCGPPITQPKFWVGHMDHPSQPAAPACPDLIFALAEFVLPQLILQIGVKIKSLYDNMIIKIFC